MMILMMTVALSLDVIINIGVFLLKKLLYIFWHVVTKLIRLICWNSVDKKIGLTL